MKPTPILFLTTTIAVATLMLTACGDADKNQPAETPKSSVTTHQRTPKRRIPAKKRITTADDATSATTTTVELATTTTEMLTSSPKELASVRKVPKSRVLIGKVKRAVTEDVTTDPLVRAKEIIATLPPLPEPTIDINTTLSQDQWKTLSTDQAVSQANARFKKAVASVKTNETLDKQECKAACTYLDGYKQRLISEGYGHGAGQLSKNQWEDLQTFVFDACSNLNDAANLSGSTTPEEAQIWLKRAEDNLKQAEAIARSPETK